MRIFILLNSLMKKQTFFILLSLTMGVFTILANVGLLSVSSVLISKAALHLEVADLMVLIVGVRFFGISRGVFRYFERIVSHDTTFRILSEIRKWFYKNFNENYTESNSKFKSGDIYTKIVSDVDVLKDFYLRAIYPLIIAILTGIITALFISYFSKIVALIYIVGYVLNGFVMPVLLFQLNNRFLERESELKKNINLVLVDMIKGILEVNLYNSKEKFSKSFKKMNSQLLEIEKKKNIISVLGDNFTAIIVSVLIVLTLIITAGMVEVNKLPPIYYAMLPLTILASFEALIQLPLAVYKFNDTYNIGKDIYSIIDKAYKFQGTEKEIENYDITVKNLSIYDEKGEKSIVNDICFELPYKKKIAIVGASGSGKSTILKALLGFIKYEKGCIKIDNTCYEELSIEEIRKNFTYIDQNSYLFNTTLRENLLIANTEAQEFEIYDLLQKFKALELVEASPEGLDTLLGQYAYNVSGGEKQRLVIVRALLKHSKIILLDEPTSSLDVKLEKKVVEELFQAIEDKSCVWVTHRLVNMDKMDEIIVLDKGVVVERGTHEQLIKNKGRYYKLWNMQRNLLSNII